MMKRIGVDHDSDSLLESDHYPVLFRLNINPQKHRIEDPYKGFPKYELSNLNRKTDEWEKLKTEFIKALRAPLFEAAVGEVAAMRDAASERTQAYLDKENSKTIKSITDTTNKTLPKKDPQKKKEYLHWPVQECIIFLVVENSLFMPTKLYLKKKNLKENIT